MLFELCSFKLNKMTCKLHKVRFYHPEPSPINCVSYNSSKKWLSLSRKNASIEIWDVKHMPCLLKVIPGVENGSIEALAWVNDRLLSTGLSGALVEWDVLKLVTKNTLLLTGSAGWCLDVNATLTYVAVGTEQGYVNLFSVENDGIIYEKLFDKQEGRVLCCKFDKTGNYLVTGSVNTIRVWNVQTGQAINRMSTARRGKEVIVWCLAVLPDLTIISGDSAGRLIFWNGHLAEQIESFSTHKADILSICVADDEKTLYCAGVDPLIVLYMKVPIYKEELGAEIIKWVKGVQRDIHEHDVRGLIDKDGTLISIGADGFISLSSYPPKRLMQIPPFLSLTTSIVCPKKNLLLLRHKTYIEIWMLGKYDTSDSGEPVYSNSGEPMYSNNNNGDLDIQEAKKPESGKKGKSVIPNIATSNKWLQLSTNPIKLLSLKTKNECEITCCAISHDGQWIAYSTELDFRIFNFCLDDDDMPSITKVVPIQADCVPCHHMTFSADNMLVTGSPNGDIRIINIDISGGAHVLQTLNMKSHLKDPSLLHLDVVSNKRNASTLTYIIAANCSGGILVWWKSKGTDYKHYITMPNYSCPVSAFAVNPLYCTLVVVYADHKLIEYNLRKKEFTAWSSTLPQTLTLDSPVTGILFDPRNSFIILLVTTSSVLVVSKSNPKTSQLSKKKRKEKLNSQTETPQFNMKSIDIKYVAGMSWLSNDEALVIEISPQSIMKQLPPVFVSKRKYKQ